MSNNPPTLRALQALLRERTGLPAVSLGVIGNAAHIRGYHLGKDRIFKQPPGQGRDDYSVKAARDRNAATDSASAIDIGNFPRLREMSKFLVSEARANAADTRDIREIIYSPDGKKVFRWDRERGFDSKPKTGEADNTHLTHTHISWYRDSEKRDKTAVFVRFFEGGPATKVSATKADPPAKADPAAKAAPPRPNVQSFTIPTVATVCTVPEGTKLFTSSRLTKVAFTIHPGRSMPFLGEIFKGVAMIHRTDEQGRPTGKVFFAKTSTLEDIRPA